MAALSRLNDAGAVLVPLATVPLAGDPTDGEAFRNAQKMRVIAPVLMLFGAAKADPQGREATIVRQLASIIDAEPDAAVIGAALTRRQAARPGRWIGLPPPDGA